MVWTDYKTTYSQAQTSKSSHHRGSKTLKLKDTKYNLVILCLFVIVLGLFVVILSVFVVILCNCLVILCHFAQKLIILHIFLVLLLLFVTVLCIIIVVGLIFQQKILAVPLQGLCSIALLTSWGPWVCALQPVQYN